MENVKVNFTNKLGVTSVVIMPVNQYVASQELLPKQYSLFVDPDPKAEGAIDSAAILKEYLKALVPDEVGQVDTDMETIAALQVQVASLQDQLAAAAKANADLSTQTTSLQAQVDSLTKANADLTAEVTSLQAQIAAAASAVKEIPAANQE